MKRLLSVIAITFAVAAVAHRVTAQGAGSTADQNRKHYLTTIPNGKGRLRFAADNIDKDWASSEIHFKGVVTAEVWPGTKGYNYVTIIHADEVDLNEMSGELSPRGNVKITLEQPK